MAKISNVAFFGFSSTYPGEALYEETFKVAREVAKAGYTIVNGGGPGVMRAASEGAKSIGGRTVGVTLKPKDMPLFEGFDPNNPLDEIIETGTYVERTLKLIDYGDVFLIMNGGTGTISEWGMAWGLARLHFGAHKPLILYGNFWYPIMEAVSANMQLRAEELRVYKIVTTPEDAVLAIKYFEKEHVKPEEVKQAVNGQKNGHTIQKDPGMYGIKGRSHTKTPAPGEA